MGILGLTHNEQGLAVQRLPVSIKVAIGEGPDPNDSHSHPKKLDHFVFKRKTMKGKEVGWEPDPEVTERYGENCRQVGIVFMDDDVENVFRTTLSWWAATERKCFGELVQIDGKFKMQATRRTERCPEGEPWPGNYKYSSQGNTERKPCEPCGDGCPDLEEGRCKPSADLYFQLDKFPMLGAVCRLHTSSYRSIRQISSALQQVIQTFGGLAGVRMMLKVRPEKGTYEQDGKKKSTTLQILSLELDAEDWKKLLANATEMKKLFHQQRSLLGAHRVEIVEDDEERAPEIAGEFAPTNEPKQLPAAAAPKAEMPQSFEEVGQRAAIHRMCSVLGFNQARENMLLGQHQGKLEELVQKLKEMCGADAPADEPVEVTAKTEPVQKAAAEKPAAKGNGKSKAFDF